MHQCRYGGDECWSGVVASRQDDTVLVVLTNLRDQEDVIMTALDTTSLDTVTVEQLSDNKHFTWHLGESSEQDGKEISIFEV